MLVNNSGYCVANTHRPVSSIPCAAAQTGETGWLLSSFIRHRMAYPAVNCLKEQTQQASADTAAFAGGYCIELGLCGALTLQHTFC